MAIEEQQVLSEIRSLRSDFKDLSLQLRIDTPWLRIRENVRYAIHVVNEIPLLARISILLGCLLITIRMMFRFADDVKRKLLMFAIDCFSLALVVISV